MATTSELKTIEHHIGGESVAGTGTRRGSVWDPATGDEQARVVLADPRINEFFKDTDTKQLAVLLSEQFCQIADHLEVPQNLRERLMYPKRSVTVSVPVRMDDGSTKLFQKAIVSNTISQWDPPREGLVLLRLSQLERSLH